MILRGRPANKFWHVVLVVVMPLIIVLGVFPDWDALTG